MKKLTMGYITNCSYCTATVSDNYLNRFSELPPSAKKIKKRTGKTELTLTSLLAYCPCIFYCR